MKKKLAIVLSLILVLAFALAGCGKSAALDGAQTVAVLDETTNMQLGELNLMLRYEEAQMQTSYGGLFGMAIYQQDMGDGTLYGDTAKTTLMEDFQRMYIMEAEAANYGVELTAEETAKITETAKQFVKDNSSKTLKALGVDQTAVERALTLAAIEYKIYDVITADVDTVVSDEEAAQKRVIYVYASTQGSEFDDAGQVIPLTDAEKAEVRSNLEAVLAEAKKSDDLETAAKAYEWTVSEATYGTDSATPDQAVQTAGNVLAEGEYSDIVETETGYYIVKLVSELDREATDQKKDQIAQNRKDAVYQEEYAKLSENHEFVIHEDVLAQITFDRLYFLVTE